jgi:hypothetical protein
MKTHRFTNFIFFLLASLFSLAETKPLLAVTKGNTDSSKTHNRNNFWWLALGHQDRAADFEENLFKDPQVLFNASVMRSSYNLSNYFTDEWLLQENDYRLTSQPNRDDASRKFNTTRLSLELSGSFLFFYGGLGMVLPETRQEISLGKGLSYYKNDTTRYYSEIKKAGFWKAGFQLHFRRWTVNAGLRGYPGILGNSTVMAQSIKTGQTTRMTGAGSAVFTNFLELGIRYQNFTFGFEKALNIDFPGAECNSFFIGYNLFDLRNFNEKRIPR